MLCSGACGDGVGLRNGGFRVLLGIARSASVKKKKKKKKKKRVKGRPRRDAAFLLFCFFAFGFWLLAFGFSHI
jgi:hypothetical protein